MSGPNEERFESEICAWLQAEGGYDAVKNDKQQGAVRDFDPVRGLDTAELFTFLGATQVELWDELVKRYGGDPDRAQAKFADRLAGELDKRGVVDVLRHGVVDQGVTLAAGVLPARARPVGGPGGEVRGEPADGDPAAALPGRARATRWTWRCSSTASRWRPRS